MNEFKKSIRVDTTKEEDQEEKTVGSQLVEFLCGNPNDPKVTEVVRKMINGEYDNIGKEPGE